MKYYNGTRTHLSLEKDAPAGYWLRVPTVLPWFHCQGRVGDDDNTPPPDLRPCPEAHHRARLFIEVVEAANIAPVVVTVRCLGSTEFEKSAAVLYGFRLNKMLEASCRQSSIRRMCGYGTTAHGAKRTINRKRSFITSSERTENYPTLQLVGNGKRYGRVGGFAFP